MLDPHGSCRNGRSQRQDGRRSGNRLSVTGAETTGKEDRTGTGEEGESTDRWVAEGKAKDGCKKSSQTGSERGGLSELCDEETDRGVSEPDNALVR